MKRLVPLSILIGSVGWRSSSVPPTSTNGAECRIGEFGFEPDGA